MITPEFKVGDLAMVFSQGLGSGLRTWEPCRITEVRSSATYRYRVAFLVEELTEERFTVYDEEDVRALAPEYLPKLLTQ